MAVTIRRQAPLPLSRPLQVRIEDCQGCGACILTCPERALRPASRNPIVDAARCTGCGECIEVCPVDAISYDMTGRHDTWSPGTMT